MQCGVTDLVYVIFMDKVLFYGWSCTSVTLDLSFALLSQHVSFKYIWLLIDCYFVAQKVSTCQGKVHCISEALETTGFPQKIQWATLAGKTSNQGGIPEDPMPYAAEDSGDTYKGSPTVLHHSALVCREWGICVVQQVPCLAVTAIS